MNKIEDHKSKQEHSTTLTSCVFNMQAYVNLLQQVFSAKDNVSSDFHDDCDYLRYLSDEIGVNVAKIKEIIPTKKVNELS